MKFTAFRYTESEIKPIYYIKHRLEFIAFNRCFKSKSGPVKRSYCRCKQFIFRILRNLHFIIRILSLSSQKYLYKNTKITALIRDRINELTGVQTQREIAAEIGYEKTNVLSMYRRGEAKLPLERLPAIARALDIDLALLFRAGLKQWWPGEQTLLNQMFM